MSSNFFPPLSAENDANETTEVESLCVNCGENGITKLLLTKIPFYKEVILSSFSCPHCNNRNNEIQSASEISTHGVEYNLRAEDASDLNRQVVKSDYASMSIPELELEIPEKSQKGEITTVEGILNRVETGLEQDQERRKVEHPEDYEKICKFLEKVRDCKEGRMGFSLKLRDISGNSFISPPPNVLPSTKDTHLQIIQFERTPKENHTIGYYPEIEAQELDDEIHQFHTPCPSCGKDCMTKMKLTKIPHFKEVVIMATDCDCGYRSNEVKSGGGMEEKGKRIKLKVTSVDDLCRDVLKSETCSLEIPELGFEMGGGSLGGKFTTLEGLLVALKEKLSEENPLITGDSASPCMREKMQQFCLKFDELLQIKSHFTVILDDPAGNSYLQNIYAPETDPQMEIEIYDRTFEQNEELGLNDMNTE